VLATNAVGTVLVVAMSFLPAAKVLPSTRQIPGAMEWAVPIGPVSIASRFVLSVEMEWPLSHSVGGVGFAAFLASHVLAQARA
jgi:ABC-type Mn2+/Zn2+ transport system permease subunit